MKFVVLGIAASAFAATANAAVIELKDANNEGVVQPLRAVAPAFNLDEDPVYQTLDGGVGRKGDAITSFSGDVKDTDNGLVLATRSLVSFTYLGSEASNENLALEISIADNVLFQNFGASASSVGDVSGPFVFNQGLLPFAYRTQTGNVTGTIANNGGSTTLDGVTPEDRLNIGYSAFFTDANTPDNGKSVLVFFGDGFGDVDFDDLGVRIDVAAVPLPAAVWMLIAGLGGLFAMGRRRAAA